MPIQYTSTDDVGSQDGSVQVYTWALTTAVPDGVPFRAVKFADRCFTGTGTWGGAALAIEFSNDGTNWFTAHNAAGGAALTLSANGGASTIERPLWMRPNLSTPGTGATVTVICVAAVNNPLRT
jgi:hypothetical protein